MKRKNDGKGGPRLAAALVLGLAVGLGALAWSAEGSRSGN